MTRWQPRALLGAALFGGLSLAACSHWPQGTTAAPGPTPEPLVGAGRGPVLPIPEGVPSTSSSSPAPFNQIPFAFPSGPNAELFVFDRPRTDVFAYPGAGSGIENVFVLNPGQYYFDDTRDIYVYDAWREERIKLVDGREVGGFAFDPSFSGDYHVYFLGQSDPCLAAKAIGLAYEKGDAAATTSLDLTNYATVSSAPSITAPPQADLSAYLGKARFLSKINSVAVLHGGLTSINVDGANDAVVFTTTDGGLYLYTPLHPQVLSLLADELVDGRFHAAAANIDSIWGRYVVWQDTRRQGIFTLDRWTGEIDSMPYANLALNAISASAANFYESDPYEVVFTLTLEDGTTRLASYNLLTERVLNLTVLNGFADSLH